MKRLLLPVNHDGPIQLAITWYKNCQTEEQIAQSDI